MRRWRALIILGTAQFLMVLDTSVMNVSISQLVEDFDTQVTAIQGVITLYTLVMAAFMITGVGFVATDQVRAAAERAGLKKPQGDALVAEYAEAQISSLEAAVLATAGITLAGFPSTRRLPTDRIRKTLAA